MRGNFQVTEKRTRKRAKFLRRGRNGTKRKTDRATGKKKKVPWIKRKSASCGDQEGGKNPNGRARKEVGEGKI